LSPTCHLVYFSSCSNSTTLYYPPWSFDTHNDRWFHLYMWVYPSRMVERSNETALEFLISKLCPCTVQISNAKTSSHMPTSSRPDSGRLSMNPRWGTWR
jgi:hypothetical protein